MFQNYCFPKNSQYFTYKIPLFIISVSEAPEGIPFSREGTGFTDEWRLGGCDLRPLETPTLVFFFFFFFFRVAPEAYGGS